MKKTCIPAEVTAAAKAKKVAHTTLKNIPETALELEKAVARVNFDNARKTHRNLWRRHLSATDNAQDSELHTLLSTNPQAAHRALKSGIVEAYFIMWFVNHLIIKDLSTRVQLGCVSAGFCRT